MAEGGGPAHREGTTPTTSSTTVADTYELVTF